MSVASRLVTSSPASIKSSREPQYPSCLGVKRLMLMDCGPCIGHEQAAVKHLGLCHILFSGMTVLSGRARARIALQGLCFVCVVRLCREVSSHAWHLWALACSSFSPSLPSLAHRLRLFVHDACLKIWDRCQCERNRAVGCQFAVGSLV